MKDTEQYFPVSAVYYAVQGGSNYESVDEILKGDRSNESISTGKKSKFPQIFYHGICMDIINSTVHEKPNKDILWFFVGQ